MTRRLNKLKRVKNRTTENDHMAENLLRILPQYLLSRYYTSLFFGRMVIFVRSVRLSHQKFLALRFFFRPFGFGRMDPPHLKGASAGIVPGETPMY